MKLRSGQSTTETSGSLGKRCLRREGNGGKQPRQSRQNGTPTCNSTGTQAATRNSPPVGTSGASTSAAPIGAMSLSGHRHPRQHRPPRPRSPERCCPCDRRAPTISLQSDDDDDDDDDDEDDNKVAEILRKEQERLARRRAAKARYRARHPERVAESRRRYRAKHPEVMAAQRRRYQARHRDRLAEQRRQYHEKYHLQRLESLRRSYYAHVEKRREYQREYWRSPKKQAWWVQYLAKNREASALVKQSRERERTLQKIQALGPLKLTVTLEDFMADFCNSLSPNPEDSMDQPGTLMDMDSGVFHPMDHSVCDESSLSSCDMWDDGRGFLDNLLEELDDLPSSDDCWFDFLTDMMQEDSSFDLDDFVV